MIHKLEPEYENLLLNEEIPTVEVFICSGSKFKLPQDFIQLLKVITVLGNLTLKDLTNKKKYLLLL